MNRGGVANKFLIELAKLPEFVGATTHSVPTERMEDRELVLRFVAFSHTPYREYGRKIRLDSIEAEENLDLFLTRHMEFLNTAPDEQRERIRAAFERAMHCAHAIFDEDAFRKRYERDVKRNPINKALFDAWSTLLAALSVDDARRLVDRSDRLLDRFRNALKSDRFFDQAVTQGTGDPRKVVKRYEVIEGIIRDTLAESDDVASA